MQFRTEIVKNSVGEIVGNRYTIKPEDFTCVLNGTRYLILEPRGCNFAKGDPIAKQSDLGNHRLLTCIYDWRNKVILAGDFMHGYRYRTTSLRGNKPLKKPVLIDDLALRADLEYDGYGMCGGKLEWATWGVFDTEKRWGIPYGKLDYTKAGILEFVNTISDAHYDKVVVANHPNWENLGFRERDVLGHLKRLEVIQDTADHLVVRFWHEDGEHSIDIDQVTMRIVG